MVNTSAVVGSHIALGSFRGRGGGGSSARQADEADADIGRCISHAELSTLNDAALRQAVAADPTNIESLIRNWEPKGTVSQDWDPLALGAVTYFTQCLGDVGLGGDRPLNQEMINLVAKVARTGDHADPFAQVCRQLLSHLKTVNGAMKSEDFTEIRTAFTNLRLCVLTLSQLIVSFLIAPENKRRDTDSGLRR